MAGRPKMMAGKVWDLYEMMEKVWKLIEEYIPEQYERHEGPLEKMDPLCRSWNEAVFAVTDASCSVGELAKMLRAKAGINEVDFREARRAERLAEMARKNEQRETPQAVACCERGTSGDTEPPGLVDIQNPS